MEKLNTEKLKDSVANELNYIVQKYDFEWCDDLTPKSGSFELVIKKKNISIRVFYHIMDGLELFFDDLSVGKSDWTISGIFYKKFGFMSKENDDFVREMHEIADNESNDRYEYHCITIRNKIKFLEENYSEIFDDLKLPNILMTS